MTDRDRLIELISQIQYMGGLESRLADHLLANGVIVPPCKVGNKIYKIFTKYQPFVSDYVVEDYGIPVKTILRSYDIIPFSEIGKTVFLTKEEAEAELKKRGKENDL